MKRVITISCIGIFLLLNNIIVNAQETYIVDNSAGIEVFDEDNTSLGIIQKDEAVSVIQKLSNSKWKIKYFGNIGFVNPQSLVLPENSVEYRGWEKEFLRSGNSPACHNIIPEYDYKVDNELSIKVGWNTDVVVKLYNLQDKCIRIAYIKSGDNYSIKNIPEGKYYLKIAYGKDFRKFREKGKCKVKFLIDPSYEKGEHILDFYKIKKPDVIKGDYIYENWEIPSYELSLNITYSSNIFKRNSFNSNEITEEDFNDE